MSPRNNKRHWPWILGLVAALVLLSLILFRDRDTTSDATRPNVSKASQDKNRALYRLPGAMDARRPRTVNDGDPPVPRGGLNPLQVYLKQSIYPPHSRPLSLQRDNLISWNKRYENLKPTNADSQVRYLFTADKYWLTGKQKLNSLLQVRRSGELIAVRITKAFIAPVSVERASDGTPGNITNLTFTQRRGTYTNTFSPSSLSFIKGASHLGVYIEFEFGKGRRQRASFRIQYNPADNVPARFTGSFSDSIVQGSLAVKAGIEVFRSGQFIIDCNLFDSRDQPVAWTRFKGRLTSADKEVTLSFFGKVIIDSEAKPPFSIRQLRGKLFAPGNNPDIEMMMPYSGTHTTAAYKLSDFSASEWDSPRKQAKIEFLRSQQSNGEPEVTTPQTAPDPKDPTPHGQ